MAVSDFYAKRMCNDLGIPEKKMHVVPLGISFDGFQKRERAASNQFVVGYFARVAPEKGLHVLCEAYRLLRQRTPERRITLEVGLPRAGYRTTSGIERQMNAWGLEELVSWRVTQKQSSPFCRTRCVRFGITMSQGMSLREGAGVPVVQLEGPFTEIIERIRGAID
jgi:glycosyltransferase involved in cell wall biosynthesis